MIEFFTFVEKTVALSAAMLYALMALVGLEYEEYIPASVYLLFAAGVFFLYVYED